MPREKTFQIDQTNAMLAPSAETFLREAEREMGAFVAAAEELYGIEASRLAAEYWIEQLDKLDSVNREGPTLRRVTVAAASRLAKNTVADSLNPPERIAISPSCNGRPAVGVTSNETLLDDVPRPFLSSRSSASKNRALEGQQFGFYEESQKTREIREFRLHKVGEELQPPFDDLSEPNPAGILRCMTEGISHDIRNYLCAVFVNVELMMFSATTQRARQELLEDIQSAIRSTIDMLDSLLLPSHMGQAHNCCLHSLNQIVAHVAKMVRTHPDARNVQLTIGEHPILEASIDRGEVGRAVYNLLLNACQAASRGSEPGTVRVTLREERSTIQIRVIDNGPGVSEAIRQALSKSLSGADERENIGLGLTIARCVAHEHGGFLELEESTMGRTIFALHLSKAKLRRIDRPCISTIQHDSASRV